MSEIQDEDLVITEIRTPSEANFSDLDPAEMDSGVYNAYRFIHDLQQAKSPDIPQDHTECPICHENYGMNGQDKRVAKMPSCGHLFCLECICRWVKPTEASRRNTCPCCRTVFFETDPVSDDEDDGEDEDDEEDTEGIIQELIDWAFPNTLANFCLGLSSIEPIMQGSRPIPRGLYYSKQMWLIWRLFIRNPAPNSNEPIDAGFMNDIKQRIARCLGQLSVRFGTLMEERTATPPWGHHGPSIEHVSDPNLHGMIEAAILEFMYVETLYAQPQHM